MRRFICARSFYLPPDLRDAQPSVPDGTDLAVYTYETTNEAGQPRYLAVVFAGKANTPLFHERFRTPEHRQREIEEAANRRRAHLARVAERAAERHNYQHDVKVGDMFSTSWGYEQTNVNFFEVTEVHGKALVLREIGQREVDHAHVVPVPGKYYGDSIRVVVRGPSIKIGDHYASPSKGEPRYSTPQGYGH